MTATISVAAVMQKVIVLRDFASTPSNTDLRSALHSCVVGLRCDKICQGRWLYMIYHVTVVAVHLRSVFFTAHADDVCSGQCRQAPGDVNLLPHPVIVNLSGLPAELSSGRIPPHWVDGIARLESHRVPGEVPAHRWRQFITDCHTFLLAKENWAERAAGHGWNDLELFGCCRRPLERLGNAGLLWAINGGRLVELRRDWAVIERASDRSRHVHHRERPKAANITLPWMACDKQ